MRINAVICDKSFGEHGMPSRIHKHVVGFMNIAEEVMSTHSSKVGESFW